MQDRIEEVARKAVVKAGDLIRRHIGGVPNTDILNKGPSDYVTEIDMKCENLIIGTISRHFPNHCIIAEETANFAFTEAPTWIIDPLDGTTNFIHGFPFVAVSIAFCVGRQVLQGWVFDPLRQELFAARKGQGAYLNDMPIRMKPPSRLSEMLIATGFPFRAKDLLNPYLDVFKQVFTEATGVRRAGSAALDLAYVAAGRVDGFWEIGLKPWDIAAGSLLVAEAGGSVKDFWGSDRYLENGHIVAGGSLVCSFLLEQVQIFLCPVLDAAQHANH